MDKTGVDFAMDVHGDEAIPVSFLAGYEGILAGHRYGEAYAPPSPLGVNDLVTTLGSWKVPPPFENRNPPWG